MIPSWITLLPWKEIYSLGERLIEFAFDMAAASGASAESIAAYVEKSKLARGLDVLAHQAAEKAVIHSNKQPQEK